MKKQYKIIIFSSGYPFGLKETFLHNEVVYLSKHFDIEIYPLLKSSNKILPIKLPSNVKYNEPILTRSYIIRVIKGIFNLAPIIPYFKDLIIILKRRENLRFKLKSWFLHLITFRSVCSSKQLAEAISGPGHILYFYWCNIPLSLIDFKKKHVFIRVHGGEVDLPRNKGYIPLLKNKIINKKRITYLPISTQALNDINFISIVNSFISRLGVYDKGLNPCEPNLAGLRIVSCSNLIKLKRVHLIIDSLALIKDIEIEWIHFGDGNLIHDLKEYATKLPKNINHVFKGRVENNKILDFYSAKHIDLFVNVSETEGVPVSIMEAFSFGIPCFATDVGGTKEIVNNENGCLVRKDFDVLELADFIRKIHESDTVNVLRSNARRTFLDKFNAERNYYKLVMAFKNLSLLTKE